MDPSIVVWLELVIFGALLYLSMHFTIARGSVARRVRRWAFKVREAGMREVDKRDEGNH